MCVYDRLNSKESAASALPNRAGVEGWYNMMLGGLSAVLGAKERRASCLTDLMHYMRRARGAIVWWWRRRRRAP